MKDFDAIKSSAENLWQKFTGPEARTRILVGMGTCGIAAGADKTFDAIKAELTRHKIDAELVRTGCIGFCSVEPLVEVVPPNGQSVSYGRVTADKVATLVSDVLVGGNPNHDLAVWKSTSDNPKLGNIPDMAQVPFFKPQKRELLRRCGIIDPENIDHAIANGAYRAFAKAFASMKPEEVIEEVKKSNLKGRGGAYYPTGMKWEQCRAARGYPKYIVCNADEGVPGAFVDRAFLEGDPHAVIEGMLIAAFAVGSDSGYIYIRAEYPLGASRFATALAQARERGLLGKNILGSDFSFDIEIRRGAGSYVCGESSAQMSSIEGQRGMPRLKRPRSVERGLWGKPTSLNNVETFANVPLIIANGAAWYLSIGTGASNGTKIFSVSGNITYTGVVEVPFGATLRTVIEGACGGVPDGGTLKAIQPDGSLGTVILPILLDTPICLDIFRKSGAKVGSGALVVFDDNTCVVDLMRFCLRFAVTESCGRCTVCRVGSQRLLDIANRMAAGQGKETDFQDIDAIASVMFELSHCGLGQGASDPMTSTIKLFREEYEAHVKEGRCPAKICPDLIEYKVVESKCTSCGDCESACPAAAIVNEDKPKIVDANCIRCGACKEVCPDGAISIEDAVHVATKAGVLAGSKH